ncbi:MAG: ATP-dependent DNA helicase RecG, partial [Alphaproteobacteria bacterium]|nr:ATP-dependent DNA helicase RecG [Alphaproteobacteria bacterium]
YKDWLLKALPIGQTRMISGKVERFRERLQIVHPDYFLPKDEFDRLPPIEPTYPLTAGLSSKVLTKALIDALDKLPTNFPEWHDPALYEKNNWQDWHSSLRQAHRPQADDDLDLNTPHRQRLAYDELLAHQLALQIARRHRRRQKGRSFVAQGKLKVQLLEALPFTLTNAQTQAIADIEADMQEPLRMLRLLQGDVGSGKTMVATVAMLHAVECGAQSAIMAPTELLAYQHAQSLAPYFDALGIKWQLFTSRNTAKIRAQYMEALANGDIDIAIGTHALFQEDITFKDLGLAVVDEQHRFGVQQRMELSSKGKGVDILLMTATPIPRTLALTSYGDMDISLMTEKPIGRQEIETKIINLDRYADVVAQLGNLLKRKQRAYWVCPLVHENDEMDLAAAEIRFKDLSKHYGDAVGLIHGQMKTAEKDKAMAKFQAGEISILVSTTVIEVGVDVPEASVMIIEHAERFGLAQLHQLRGRVGRGTEKSSCLLLYRAPLGQTAQSRLTMMRQTNDGFLIAEKDLHLRGAGEVLGTRQSGMPLFKLADIDAHKDLLAIASDDAKAIIQTDPKFESERGQALRHLLFLFKHDRTVRYLRA